jgi:hypothetical protein
MTYPRRRHCEKRSDEAIQLPVFWIAPPVPIIGPANFFGPADGVAMTSLAAGGR